MTPSFKAQPSPARTPMNLGSLCSKIGEMSQDYCPPLYVTSKSRDLQKPLPDSYLKFQH